MKKYRVTYIGPDNTLLTKDIEADEVGYDGAHALAFLRKNGTRMVDAQEWQGKGKNRKLVQTQEEVPALEAFITFRSFVFFEIVDEPTIN